MTGIVEGIGRPGAARMVPRAVTRAGFEVLVGQADPHRAATAAAPAASLSPMLALQEMGAEVPADRDARRHGNDMLAALADLQRALLLGSDDASALERLADLVAAVPRAADPRLAALVSAVVVRVRVELARRQPADIAAR
jgi:hypothetical protein